MRNDSLQEVNLYCFTCFVHTYQSAKNIIIVHSIFIIYLRSHFHLLITSATSSQYSVVCLILCTADGRLSFYHPHPKDGGRFCFQFVSSHLDWGGGGIPSQVWMGEGGIPSQVQRGGYPSQIRWGRGVSPNPGLDGVPPPPIQDWMGYSPPPPVRRQISITSTCYTRAVCLLRSRRGTFFFLIKFSFQILLV